MYFTGENAHPALENDSPINYYAEYAGSPSSNEMLDIFNIWNAAAQSMSRVMTSKRVPKENQKAPWSERGFMALIINNSVVQKAVAYVKEIERERAAWENISRELLKSMPHILLKSISRKSLRNDGNWLTGEAYVCIRKYVRKEMKRREKEISIWREI